MMTKKSKILTISLAIFAVIVFFVVLSSTIFSVQKINVLWLTETKNLSTITSEQIIEDSGIKKGTNVFFVSKNQAMSNLEKKYPYIEVINIETIFPNTLNIHARERQEVFALKQNEKYYIVDSSFKILKIWTSFNENSKETPILINGDFQITQSEGEFADIPQSASAFKILETSFYQNCSDDETKYNLSRMKALIKSATFNESKIILQTFYGVKIEILQPSISKKKLLLRKNVLVHLQRFKKQQVRF